WATGLLIAATWGTVTAAHLLVTQPLPYLMGSYLLVVLIAGLVKDLRAGLVVMAGSILAGAVMSGLQLAGWSWGRSFTPSPLTLFWGNAILLMLAVLLLWLFVRTRMHSEEQARRERDRLRLILDTTMDGYILADGKGQIIAVNPAYCEMIGYSAEELCRMNINQLEAALDQEQINRRIREMMAAGSMRFETRHRRKDGRVIDLEVSISIMQSDIGPLVAAFVRDVTERKLAEARLHSYAERLRLLHEVDQAILAAQSPTGIAQAALEKLRAIIPYDRASVMAFDLDKMQARQLAAIPTSDVESAGSWPLRPVTTILARLAAGEVYRVDDVTRLDQPTQFHRRLLELNLRSAFSVPLRVQDTLLGNLNLQFAAPDAFDEEDILFARQVADQLAVALTQARLVEDRERRWRELAILYEASRVFARSLDPEEIGQQLIVTMEQLMAYTYGAVLIRDEETDEILPLALSDQGRGPEFVVRDKEYVRSKGLRVGQGIVGWVIQNGRSVRLGDVRRDPRYVAMREDVVSELCVPLAVGDKVIGALNVESAEPNAYTEDDERLLMALAGPAALAIENARLYEQTRRHALELEERVARRTAELEAANRELEAFAYSVSHDLRAPLRAIQGFAEIIADRYRSHLPEEGRQYFDYIVEAGQNMYAIIQDLLDYSRLGRVALKLEPVSVAETLSSAWQTLSVRAAEEDAHLEVSGPLPTVVADRHLLERMFTNLLDNALTYHRPGEPPHITVSARQQGEDAIIYMRDEGIGIEPRFHNAVFDMFQRLHSSEEYPGTGIGLAIVHKCATLMNGQVGVESEPGRGSTFWIRLPGSVS
ncbi:MAG: PAS domain S-box protein, partial [Caldilineae bacterium]